MGNGPRVGQFGGGGGGGGDVEGGGGNRGVRAGEGLGVGVGWNGFGVDGDDAVVVVSAADDDYRAPPSFPRGPLASLAFDSKISENSNDTTHR